MDHTRINTLQDLANYLRCDLNFLRNAIDNEYTVTESRNVEGQLVILGHSPKNVQISRHRIKKKGNKGGHRIVHEIRTYQLESSLKILNTYLAEIFKPCDNVHGFVKGLNTRTNAFVHLEKNYILSVDIKDYFETIPFEWVVEGLKRIGFKGHVAEWIGNIVTIDGYLVQGFCTSPTIANIVTEELDKKLKKFSSQRIDYTRYADDLYFSSNNEVPNLVAIKNLIENFGFQLNHKKSKIMRRGQPQYVTGLTVFDSSRPRIAKKVKRNIRLEIYYLTTFGYYRHARRRLINSGADPEGSEFNSQVLNEVEVTRNRLYGWLSYIYAIEPQFAERYYEKIKRAKP
ncbi:reverse transcriptase family protein [Flagellimonas oceanensis]|uniref:reverse transcriptase family protein n=1 Tax=Flagellimonas oceanensis TaxID=2499163 RepID=UPI003BAA6C40